MDLPVAPRRVRGATVVDTEAVDVAEKPVDAWKRFGRFLNLEIAAASRLVKSTLALESAEACLFFGHTFA